MNDYAISERRISRLYRIRVPGCFKLYVKRDRDNRATCNISETHKFPQVSNVPRKFLENFRDVISRRALVCTIVSDLFAEITNSSVKIVEADTRVSRRRRLVRRGNA